MALPEAPPVSSPGTSPLPDVSSEASEAVSALAESANAPSGTMHRLSSITSASAAASSFFPHLFIVSIPLPLLVGHPH
ncbi:MAG: hypothetical protein AB7V55_06480, partial [Oscillospiraceae bacterium]